MKRAIRAILVLTATVLIPACGEDKTTTNTITGPSVLDWPPPGTCVGLSGGTLIFFAASSPGTIMGSVPVSGIDPAFRLVGIDFRPATRQLYGLAINESGSLEFRLYAINPSTGTTGLTGIPAAGVAGFSSTASYGIDFNPVVDRLRVVNSVNENCRVNPNTGALAGNDTDLTFGVPATGPITGAAYTNSVGATQTTLYAIDTGAAQLTLIGGINGTPSPNGGAVASVGPLNVAVDASSNAALDITPGGTAYAVLGVGGLSNLYTVNLTTGAATLVGPIGNGGISIIDLAVAR